MQQVSPQRRAAALLNGRHDLELTQAQVPLLGLAPRRSMTTKDVGDLQGEAPHEVTLRGLQGFQWADHFTKDIGGDLDVVRRGVQALMSQ